MKVFRDSAVCLGVLTLSMLLQKLAIHRILSAPVVQSDGDISGFVDVRDILSSFLKGQDVTVFETRLLAIECDCSAKLLSFELFSS